MGREFSKSKSPSIKIWLLNITYNMDALNCIVSPLNKESIFGYNTEKGHSKMTIVKFKHFDKLGVFTKTMKYQSDFEMYVLI